MEMEQFMMAVPPARTAMFSGDTATWNSASDPEMMEITMINITSEFIT